MAIITLSPSQLKQISVDHASDADFINVDNDNMGVINSWFQSNPASLTAGGIVLATSTGKIGVSTTELFWDSVDKILRIGPDTNGVDQLSQSMKGLELRTKDMNASSAQYGFGIKFISSDSNFASPKFLAGILPRATEVYASSTDGGMAIDFFVTPNDPGDPSLPVRKLSIDANGLNLNNTSMLNFGAASNLTIAGDAITITGSHHVLVPESGTSDDLININGGTDGTLVILRGSSGNTITVRETGNIRLGATTRSIAAVETFLVLFRRTATSTWCELSYVAN